MSSRSIRVRRFNENGRAIDTSTVAANSVALVGAQKPPEQHQDYTALVATPSNRRLGRTVEANLTIIRYSPGLSPTSSDTEPTNRRPHGSPPPQHLATPQVGVTATTIPSSARHSMLSTVSRSPVPSTTRPYRHQQLDQDSDDDDDDNNFVGGSGKGLREIPVTKPDSIRAVSNDLAQAFEAARGNIGPQSTLHRSTTSNQATSPTGRPNARQALMLLEQQTILDRIQMQNKYTQALQRHEIDYGNEAAALRAELERSKKIHNMVSIR